MHPNTQPKGRGGGEKVLLLAPSEPKSAAPTAAAVAASSPRVVVSSSVPRARPRGLAEGRCGPVAHCRVAEVEAILLLLLEGSVSAKRRRGERRRSLRRS